MYPQAADDQPPFQHSYLWFLATRWSQRSAGKATWLLPPWKHTKPPRFSTPLPLRQRGEWWGDIDQCTKITASVWQEWSDSFSSADCEEEWCNKEGGGKGWGKKFSDARVTTIVTAGMWDTCKSWCEVGTSVITKNYSDFSNRVTVFPDTTQQNTNCSDESS